jgi:translation initiation factor IF-3
MRRAPRRPYVRREETAQHKINQKITVPEVRLVVEGSAPIVVSTPKAIDMAEAEGLDLVEISPKAVPPVCKNHGLQEVSLQSKKKTERVKSQAEQGCCKRNSIWSQYG